MKFDVIIGNPPYQSIEDGNKKKLRTIYQKFVDLGKGLSPNYLSMIIPSRWFSGGKGLDGFRKSMLNDRRIKIITDFFGKSTIFKTVQIAGGVLYFIWNKDYRGDCEYEFNFNGLKTKSKRPLNEFDNFIRFNIGVDVVKKVREFKEASFIDIVNPAQHFMKDYTFSDYKKEQSDEFPLKMFLRYGEIGFVNRDQIKRNHETIDKYKIYMKGIFGVVDLPYKVLPTPIFGDKGAVCSDSFNVVGPFDSKVYTENVISYMKTKFFRFLVLLLKSTPQTPRKVYSFVPFQDFSKPWTDQELYEKYNLNREEIDFIESMIK